MYITNLLGVRLLRPAYSFSQNEQLLLAAFSVDSFLP